MNYREAMKNTPAEGFLGAGGEGPGDFDTNIITTIANGGDITIRFGEGRFDTNIVDLVLPAVGQGKVVKAWSSAANQKEIVQVDDREVHIPESHLVSGKISAIEWQALGEWLLGTGEGNHPYCRTNPYVKVAGSLQPPRVINMVGSSNGSTVELTHPINVLPGQTIMNLNFEWTST